VSSKFFIEVVCQLWKAAQLRRHIRQVSTSHCDLRLVGSKHKQYWIVQSPKLFRWWNPTFVGQASCSLQIIQWFSQDQIILEPEPKTSRCLDPEPENWVPAPQPCCAYKYRKHLNMGGMQHIGFRFSLKTYISHLFLPTNAWLATMTTGVHGTRDFFCFRHVIRAVVAKYIWVLCVFCRHYQNTTEINLKTAEGAQKTNRLLVFFL